MSAPPPNPPPPPPPPTAVPCPQHVLDAIYGGGGGGAGPSKREAYEASLTRWWGEYADRKNDDADDHVADSLLYDRNHLPRSAPAPECVARAAAAAAAGKAAGPGTPAPEGG